uniref:ATP-dependent (S)-NAD(P)H-hydrate dehydratase n=2 Tax=Arion vulgaris TaxID=1028688 RepID=A0A0B6ZE48_9EUPU
MFSIISVILSALKRPVPYFTGNLSSEQIRLMATHSPVQLLEMVKSVIPPLQFGMHKGQAGRVAVIGGCQEYTGAPYFAAISALKTGADLSHVFCSAGAATVIKGYSPELIVHPLLDSQDALNEFSQWLPRFHALVVGPGLGRDSQILKTVALVIQKALQHKLPVIIDADGLFLVTQDPSLINGHPTVILTPNAAEFGRLYKKVFDRDPNVDEPIISVKELSRKLGYVTIVHKGLQDIISNGEQVLVCTEPGSFRRCGGQGDLLSGSMGIFAFWSTEVVKKGAEGSTLQIYGPGMCAAYAACALTRVCNRHAFEVCGRSMTTTDMISQIHNSFQSLFT